MKRTKKEFWIIGFFAEAQFKMFAIAETKDEALKVAKALEDWGKPLIWKAETV